MNETDQVRDDTKPIPSLKDIHAEPQKVSAQPITDEPVEGLDGSTIRLDRLPHLTASFVAAQEAVLDREIQPFSEKRESEVVDDYIPPEKVIEHPPERYVPKFYKWCTIALWAIGILALGYGLLRWRVKWLRVGSG